MKKTIKMMCFLFLAGCGGIDAPFNEIPMGCSDFPQDSAGYCPIVGIYYWPCPLAGICLQEECFYETIGVRQCVLSFNPNGLDESNGTCISGSSDASSSSGFVCVND